MARCEAWELGVLQGEESGAEAIFEEKIIGKFLNLIKIIKVWNSVAHFYKTHAFERNNRIKNILSWKILRCLFINAQRIYLRGSL
jgi:hypothetical protein